MSLRLHPTDDRVTALQSEITALRAVCRELQQDNVLLREALEGASHALQAPDPWAEYARQRQEGRVWRS